MKKEKIDLKKLMPFYEAGKPPKPVDIDFRDEVEKTTGRKWGAQGLGKLRMVLVHRPGEEALWGTEDPAYFNLPEGQVNLEKMQREHDEFVEVLKKEGTEVVYLNPKQPVLGTYGFPLRALTYTRGCWVINGGAIVSRSAMAYWRGAEMYWARSLIELGCPILNMIHGKGSIMEGSNLVWLDSNTALIAISLRGNLTGFNEAAQILQMAGVEVHAAYLPGYLTERKWQVGGSSGYFHLDMVFDMADENLGVIYPGGVDYATIQYLEKRGINLIEVPDEELRNDAPNLLPLEPGKVIIPAGSPKTTRELRKEGVDIIELDMSEYVKGGGGPTCITMPLIRDGSWTARSN